MRNKEFSLFVVFVAVVVLVVVIFLFVDFGEERLVGGEREGVFGV